ncbi:amino acid ABC transporter permease [Robbsia sp. Bb-Pol-6]|uniref:Amino acid ABC transporter permease n=1 Tax=Robbsia betulipollinis TaxID=2981849 RepID=A0ABT3ZH97_9BURK|nr:amino acid ABC transporter permease [Robbsia betulipollinis]MCY0385904.1 amino acid ABC transporter permease [Robbsia betulipollinis]
MKLHFDVGAVLQGSDGTRFAQGLLLTLEIALAAWLLAMLLGVALACLRLTRNRIAAAAVAGFVAYHRNVPMLVQVLFWYFGISTILPTGMQNLLNDYNGQAIFSVIAIGCCSGAYLCEDIRSGLRSIPAGQFEASRALGLNFARSMRFVILPQALRNAIPSMINHTVLLFKNTSLAMAIGAAELTYTSRAIENETFLSFETYFVATVLYLAISLLVMGAGAMLEQRVRLAGAR